MAVLHRIWIWMNGFKLFNEYQWVQRQRQRLDKQEQEARAVNDYDAVDLIQRERAHLKVKYHQHFPPPNRCGFGRVSF